MVFICQIQMPDARAWLAEVTAALKHEEFTWVVVRLLDYMVRATASVVQEQISKPVLD